MDRQSIRTDVYSLLVEASGNSHFTDDVLNGYINRAAEYLAALIEHPRDMAEVTSEDGIGAYQLPDDCVLIRTAYFGDPTKTGDMVPLSVIKEEILKELFPNWMDETDATTGQPKFIFLLNKKDVFIYPRPSSDYAGKILRINYVYVPDPMSQEIDIPDLPLIYHAILKFYVCYLCYLQLGNKDLSDKFLSDFAIHKKAVEATATKETEEAFRFQWGFQETD